MGFFIVMLLLVFLIVVPLFFVLFVGTDMHKDPSDSNITYSDVLLRKYKTVSKKRQKKRNMRN